MRFFIKTFLVVAGFIITIIAGTFTILVACDCIEAAVAGQMIALLKLALFVPLLAAGWLTLLRLTAWFVTDL